MRRRGRSSYLALDPVLLPLPSQTPLYSTTISKALRTALRGRAVANFVELRYGEVRRNPIRRSSLFYTSQKLSCRTSSSTRASLRPPEPVRPPPGTLPSPAARCPLWGLLAALV